MPSSSLTYAPAITDIGLDGRIDTCVRAHTCARTLRIGAKRFRSVWT